MSSLAHNYRKLYRSYRKTSRHPHPPVPRPINAQIRSLISSGISDHQLQSLSQYLVASHLHQELVRRYNPADDLTEPERLKATVNRVGLNMPKELDLKNPLQ
ncbi:uncharacterized protein VP01_294g7 [Puccinia sorghi]|uniref:Uncharacterized protein n=1 Tax=Puccinia sorghi TaxID=27349 RepID=A0A0L6V2R5_9BASI|nr:uncharacterized protein VP01_294g7 [Puccinia sorghi]